MHVCVGRGGLSFADMQACVDAVLSGMWGARRGGPLKYRGMLKAACLFGVFASPGGEGMLIMLSKACFRFSSSFPCLISASGCAGCVWWRLLAASLCGALSRRWVVVHLASGTFVGSVHPPVFADHHTPQYRRPMLRRLHEVLQHTHQHTFFMQASFRYATHGTRIVLRVFSAA